MKKLLFAVIVAGMMLPAAAMARPGDNTGFVRTSKKYNERDNYAAACRSEFGRRAKVADWMDIRDEYSRHPDMRDFIRDTGMYKRKDSALIHYRGEKRGPRGEAYYVQMRDHRRSKRHEGIIDDIGRHLFELKVRNNNAKPIMCYIPERERHHMRPPVGPVSAAAAAAAAAAEPPRPHREPRLLSTSRSFREWDRLNDRCRDEFGRGARVADWSDVKRMVRSPGDLDRFLRDNRINHSSRDRLLYSDGRYKNHRDRHYYLVYNRSRKSPPGVRPVDRMHGNRLNLAAMMHLRSPILCWVP